MSRRTGPPSAATASADARPDAPCPNCGSTRILSHPELDTLSIAHLDCDAFYAAIEKRDDPSLNDKPLIVGGEVRGVVSTACYIARTYGVRSAMPMFQAKKLCPQAVILKPRHCLLQPQSRGRSAASCEELTPLVEPLSLDEAYLDLSGTEQHARHAPGQDHGGAGAAASNSEVGITVSIGLSGNKFLAKLACELDKPRGFAVIGMAEAKSFLRDKPVGHHSRRRQGAAGEAGARRHHHHRPTAGCRSRASWRSRYGATGLWLAPDGPCPGFAARSIPAAR